MPPIDKKLPTRIDAPRKEANARVEVTRAEPSSVGSLSLESSIERGHGAHKVVGRHKDAPAQQAKSGGAKNASLGLSSFDVARTRLKRGLVVAMLGLALGQGGLAHALDVNAAVPTQQTMRKAKDSMKVAADARASIVAVGPPPLGIAHDIVPGATFTFSGTTPGSTVQVRVPEPGRDQPLLLTHADGSRTDVTRPRGDLPARMIEREGFVVEHGDDPGDYYCEHALFAQQRFAFEMWILKNAHGESLTGFLHVPHDEHTNAPADAEIDASQRYARHREVIGAAVFGFFHDAKKMTPDDVRILITGYGPFMSITNNPAGGFVSDRSNIDAAMQHAFGDALVSTSGELQADRAGSADADTMTIAYQVKDGEKVRRVLITAERLDVADHELRQDDPGSLIGAMREVRPHAMLSLGVHSGISFKVEHHADDGGLAIAADGTMTHTGSKNAEQAFLDNYALARAIWQKVQSTQVPTPRV